MANTLKFSWGANLSFRSAAVIGSIAEFRALLADQSDVGAAGPEGLTALHLVCRSSEPG